MKTIFRYPGGKSRSNVQRIILNHFPKEYSEYREPFVGGGGIYWSVDANKQRWINDRNTYLIAVYRALHDRPEDFIADCRQILPSNETDAWVASSRGALHNKRLKEKFLEFRDALSVDPALCFFFLNRCSFSGRVILEPSSKRTYFSSSIHWDIIKGDALEQAAETVRGTAITCGDYEQLFTAPGSDVLIYADPPYVVDTKLPRSGKLYQHGFAMDDHKRLAKIVKDCQHKVCLSYDDHPLIREMYKDFFIHEATWKYSGSSLAKKKDGKELIITNYPVNEVYASASHENLGLRVLPLNGEVVPDCYNANSFNADISSPEIS